MYVFAAAFAFARRRATVNESWVPIMYTRPVFYGARVTISLNSELATASPPHRAPTLTR